MVRRGFQSARRKASRGDRYRGAAHRFAAFGKVGYWRTDRGITLNGSDISSIDDIFGALDATQAVAANQPAYAATGWVGLPCADYGATGTKGLGTANVSIGINTMIAVVQGNASSGYVMTQKATDNYIFGGINSSIRANRGTDASQRNVAGGVWVRDSVKKQVASTFNGTHATHLALVNGIDTGAASVTTADPGTGAGSGAVGLGCNATDLTGFTLRGLGVEWQMWSQPMPPSILRRQYKRQKAEWKLP